MTVAILYLLVFLGGVGMTLFGTAIYIREEVKPAIEEIQQEESK